MQILNESTKFSASFFISEERKKKHVLSDIAFAWKKKIISLPRKSPVAYEDAYILYKVIHCQCSLGLLVDTSTPSSSFPKVFAEAFELISRVSHKQIFAIVVTLSLLINQPYIIFSKESHRTRNIYKAKFINFEFRCKCVLCCLMKHC